VVALKETRNDVVGLEHEEPRRIKRAIRQLAEGLDAVELAGFDQRRDDGPMLGAAIRRDLMMPGF
jgi:hypothetical protein